MCAVAPGRGLNDAADLADGLSYQMFGRPIRPTPGTGPAPAAATAATTASAPASDAQAAPLKRRVPGGDPAQAGDLITPAFAPGSSGYKALTGL